MKLVRADWVLKYGGGIFTLISNLKHFEIYKSNTKNQMVKYSQKSKSKSSEKFYSKKTFNLPLIQHFLSLYDYRKQIPLFFSNESCSLLRETSIADTCVFKSLLG